jgi:hypothetical protein
MLFVAGSAIEPAEVYNRDFVIELNKKASQTNGHSDYINELFMYFFMPIYAYTKLFKLHKVNAVKFQTLSFFNWMLYRACKVTSTHLGLLPRMQHFLANITLVPISLSVIIVTSLLYPLLALVKYNKSQAKVKSFTLIRSPASLSKLRFLQNENGADFYFDDLFKFKSQKISLYAGLKLWQKLWALALIPIKCLDDLIKLTQDTIKLFGIGELGFILYHYAFKISHKCLYEYYLSRLIENNKGNYESYITAHKEDRFAVVDAKLSKKYNLRLICIPHGVEYGFYVPAGLPGDVFYCTTRKAAEHLNILYNTNKFIFDETIAFKMFSRNTSCKSDKKIVFFTEAQGTHINLRIIEELSKLNLNFYVKLHPKDKKEYYCNLADKFQFLDDFDVAISNSICLARKSTVLVEALYNHSTANAILLNLVDRAFVDCMIPSLLENKIGYITTVKDLRDLLVT